MKAAPLPAARHRYGRSSECVRTCFERPLFDVVVNAQPGTSHACDADIPIFE